VYGHSTVPEKIYHFLLTTHLTKLLSQIRSVRGIIVRMETFNLIHAAKTKGGAL
jgi:hypothetical protein